MAFERLRAELQLDTSGFESGVKDAQSDLDGLANRAADTGRSLQRAGGVMTAGISAPIGAMAAGSASAAADFDANMQESIAVMGDVSDSMQEDLEETARDVATNMAVSHDEAAESFYFLASAGMDAVEAQEAMADVAAFAEAGQLDMATASDTATNVMSAFGKEADELDQVVDTLTGTVTNHNQTAEGMATAMSRVAPTAAGLGAEIEEVSGAIGLLGDVGLQGERAGTALNTVMSQMADESGPAAQQMEEMGVSVRDSEGEMRPLVDIIEDFEQAGADAGDMAEIFGTRGGPAMSALLEQGSDALEETTGDLEEMDGITEEVAETQRDTFNAQLDILRSNIRDAGIAIGADLLPMLTELVDRLQPAAEWFQDLSERQRQLIIAGGALLAVLGPLAMMFGTFLTMLPLMAKGVGILAAAIGVLSGPILVVVAAVGLLVAAFATDFMGIRSLVEETVQSIISYLEPMISVLREDFIETLEVVRGRVDTVLTFLNDIWNAHGDQILGFIDWYLTPLQTAFEMVMMTIETVVKTAMDALVTAIRVGLAIVRGDWEEVWTLITEFLERHVERFGELGQNLMQTLAEGIREYASEPVDAIRGVMEDVREYLPFSPAKEGPLSDLDESGQALPETFGDGIEEGGDDLESTFDSELEGMGDYEPRAGGGGESANGQQKNETEQQMLEEIKALREALETLRLKVEMGIDSREFNRIIDDRAEAVVEDTIT